VNEDCKCFFKGYVRYLTSDFRLRRESFRQKEMLGGAFSSLPMVQDIVAPWDEEKTVSCMPIKTTTLFFRN